MERVVFYIEATGDLIEGLLNPESMTLARTAGLRPRTLDGLPVTSPTQTDDGLIYTGGGTTTAELELLFDTRIPATTVAAAETPNDVRDLTRRFWDLSESQPDGTDGWQPEMRLIWGHWSLPVVVTAVAERLEDFDVNGAPARSWLKLGLRRVMDRARLDPAPADPPPVGDDVRTALSQMTAGDFAVESAPFQDDGDDALFRIDLLAARTLGDPRNWRYLAELNALDDPLSPPSQPIVTVLRDGEGAQ